MKKGTFGFLEIRLCLNLKWQHYVRKDELKISHICWYVVCSRVYLSRVISTTKMVFKMAAMGYPQINNTSHLKWLLMDRNHDFLINYIELLGGVGGWWVGVVGRGWWVGVVGRGWWVGVRGWVCGWWGWVLGVGAGGGVVGVGWGWGCSKSLFWGWPLHHPYSRMHLPANTRSMMDVWWRGFSRLHSATGRCSRWHIADCINCSNCCKLLMISTPKRSISF